MMAIRSSGILLASALSLAALAARPAAQQETKPVPKDSVRVRVRGCTKGYMFTAGAPNEAEPTTAEIREGMHLRMNAPKKTMSEIKAHEGSMVELTGLMKKGQFIEGVNVGKGVRIAPGSGSLSNPTATVPQLDIESWQPIAGNCKS